MSAGSAQPARLLAGQRAAILSCKAQADGHTVLSGGEDGAVCVFDLRLDQAAHRFCLGEAGEAVSSLALHPSEPWTAFAACGRAVVTLDLRQAGGDSMPAVQRYEANSDEVNCVAVHARATYLAAGDDAGVVQVLDLRTHEQYKALRGAHANICAAVAFRAHRPWELLSGGLDAALVRWDFAAGRPRRAWQMADEPGGAQVFNPPLVHGLAAGPAAAPRAIGRLVAVARGDGAIAVYDADSVADRGTARGQASSHRSRGEPARAGATMNGHAGGDAAAAHQAAGDGGGGAVAGGRLALLGAELGGHRRAASCVSFLADGTGRRLVSGANDRRVLLWDWTAALPAGSEWAQGGDGGGDPGAHSLLHAIEHGAKVNCVEAPAGVNGRQLLLVGCTQRRLAVYELR